MPKCVRFGRQELVTLRHCLAVSIATVLPISHVTGTLLPLHHMRRHIDLVLVFKAVNPSPSSHFSKQAARKDAQYAEDQYTRLLNTLRNAGLYAVGRRGEHQGQLILLVSCSGHQLHQLMQREWQDLSLAHNPFLLLNLSLQPFGRPSRPLNMCIGYRSERHQTCRTPAPRVHLCYSHNLRRWPWHPSRQRCLVSCRIRHGTSRP